MGGIAKHWGRGLRRAGSILWGCLAPRHGQVDGGRKAPRPGGRRTRPRRLEGPGYWYFRPPD